MQLSNAPMCLCVWALGEEHEEMMIEANHSRICWVCEHNDQSALFENLLNS